MKLKLSLVVGFTFVTVLFASFAVPYNNAKSPSLILPEAYGQAMSALGSLTNQFHCINATVEANTSPQGEWLFTFYTTNLIPKFVTVEFNGKTHTEDILAR